MPMNVPLQEWSRVCTEMNGPSVAKRLNTTSQISDTQREFAGNPYMNDVGINLYHAIY